MRFSLRWCSEFDPRLRTRVAFSIAWRVKFEVDHFTIAAACARMRSSHGSSVVPSLKSLIFGALLIAATPTGVDFTTSLVGRPPETFSRSRCCRFTGTVDDMFDGLAAS